MTTALIEVASKLKDDTLVYPGHEYTVQNLKFAKHVDPDNKDIDVRNRQMHIYCGLYSCICTTQNNTATQTNIHSHIRGSLDYA